MGRGQVVEPCGRTALRGGRTPVGRGRFRVSPSERRPFLVQIELRKDSAVSITPARVRSPTQGDGRPPSACFDRASGRYAPARFDRRSNQWTPWLNTIVLAAGAVPRKGGELDVIFVVPEDASPLHRSWRCLQFWSWWGPAAAAVPTRRPTRRTRTASAARLAVGSSRSRASPRDRKSVV